MDEKDAEFARSEFNVSDSCNILLSCVYFHKTYFIRCAPETGYLVTCMNDIRVILMQILSSNERSHKNVEVNKKLQLSLMEPTIEYIMKCVFNGLTEVRNEVSHQKYTCYGQYYI